MNKARLIERIAELVNERKLDGISDLRDESDRDGMRIVIELKRDAVPEVVLNQLYKQTPLQESFGVNMLAIVDGRPQLLTLKDALQVFLDAPPRGRHPAHGLRAAQGRGAAAHPRRPEDRARQPRPGDRPHPRRRRIPPTAREGLMAAFGLCAAPGAGHPRHAPAAPHRPRARQDPRGARRDARSRSRASAQILADEREVSKIIVDELRAHAREVRRRRAARRSSTRPPRSRSRT